MGVPEGKVCFVRARRVCALPRVVSRPWRAVRRARAHVAHVPRLHASRLGAALSFLLDAECKGPERGHVRGNTALL